MKKIAHIVLFAVALLFSVPMLQAQESRQARFERIEAEKVAYITKELQLTAKEAQGFFPIYNEYRKEINNVVQVRMSENGKPGQRPSRMDELAIETELLAIKKKYRSQFSTIVGSARASRFFEVEREFREKLVLELRRRGGGHERMH